jgi:GntR family transcriptional regulator
MPPRWQEIARALMAEIASGAPPVGARMPGEFALCRRFGVSRITLRHALSELERRGLVSRRRGAGTRVEAAVPRAVYVHDGSSVEEVLRFTMGIDFELLAQEAIAADAAIASELGIEAGADVARLRNLRRAPGAPPICLSEHLLPAALAAAAEPLAGFTGSLASRIAAASGEEVAGIRQSLGAVSVGVAEAELLEAQAGGPALLSHRLYLGREGRVLLASRSLFPAGRYLHTAVLRRAGMPDLGDPS